MLRLIGLTYLLGPRKADAPASARLRPILLGRFRHSSDSPVNREAARLLAFLDEPGPSPRSCEHQATVSDLKAQIHDAYCLRAMKTRLDPGNEGSASGPGIRSPASGKEGTASRATST